ncbi:hypothetical protein ACK83U_13260 [Rhizobium sp. WW22]|uniref:hypothetical protein n=1 Tax=Rhizobium sp. WW22 TaxID=3389070 RepID=UPI003999A758
MFLGGRADAEKELAHALSRQIGYTSGAYDLARIFSVLDVFSDNPSAYKEEVIAHLRANDNEESSEAYLAEITNFAQSMRLIETVSSRDARLQRLAPTEYGRSLLGARHLGNDKFFTYFATKVVLLADADYLTPILLYDGPQDSADLHSSFISFQEDLRERRMRWLAEAIPEKVLLDRIVRQITWLKLGKGIGAAHKIEIPSRNTARHHATPRQGWLYYLGMRDENKKVTDFGRAVIKALVPCSPYFWLGPLEGVEETLQLAPAVRKGGPFEDTFNLSGGNPIASEEEIESILDDIAEIMIRGFPYAKLVHASQASLKLPIEYIHYRSYRDKRLYPWETVIQRLFSVKRGLIERFSAHRGQVGFYRLKAEFNDGNK